MYIQRELESKIQPFLRRREALSVLGPRQVGKTTFIEHLAGNFKKEGKKVRFFTFEKKTDLELFQDSVEDFRDLIIGSDVVIIDEFQYAKNGGQNLKYLYDTTKIKFIISGSSSFELQFQTGKYMVGRLLDFQLWPFSFREYLSFADRELYGLLEKKIGQFNFWQFNIKNGFGAVINQRLTRHLEQYSIYGAYPAAALSKTREEKHKVLEGILEKYLLRDVKSLLNLATDDELIKLSRFLAAQIGNLLSYQELSNTSGLSYREVLKHLNILEKTFIIKLCRPYFTNKRTELTKNPKNYFVDLGLRNYLLNDFRSAEQRNDLGAIMENYAFNTLFRWENAGVKFWRTKSKAEVDFVIEKEGKIIPIEIKYGNKAPIGKSLYSFIEKFHPAVAVILTKDLLSEEKIKGTKIKFIPLSYA